MARYKLSFESAVLHTGANEIEIMRDGLGDLADIQHIDHIVTSAMDDVNDLDAISDIAQDIIQTCPNPIVLESLDISIRDITSRLGLKHITKQISIEQYSDHQKIAVEGILGKIAEGVVAVLKKIAEMIKALWVKLVKFVKNMFDANLNLKKSTEKLKEKIQKQDFTVVDEGYENNRFENESLAKNFAAPNVVDYNVVQDMVKLHTAFNEKSASLSKAIEVADNIVMLMQQQIKSTDASNYESISNNIYQKVHTATGFLIEYMVPTGKEVVKTGSAEGHQEAHEVRYPDKNHALFDGKQVVVEINLQTPNPKMEDSEAEYSITFKMENHENVNKEAKELEILNKDEMLKMCDMILALTKGNEVMYGNIEKTGKAVDKFVSDIEKLAMEAGSSKLEKEEDPDKKSEISSASKKVRKSLLFVRKVISTVGTKSGAFAGTISGLNVKMGNGMYKYVVESSKKYKK